MICGLIIVQNEVLHSAPLVTIPKSNMKAPPLDPSNPTPAHQWLPVPSASAKLRSNSVTSSSGTPTSPPSHSTFASSAAHSIPGPQVFGRFPPTSQNLSEQDLDPYFANFESSTRELEILLQGNIERVNRRTLNHVSSLSTDMAELGARYNGFSLSEQSPTVAAAIERIGQAVDSSYIATEELSSTLGASFAEPMRESAQFAGVVRSVLRFRILKRVQEEMTKDELQKKRALLDTLERSETESQRISQYLSSTGAPSRSASTSARNSSDNPSRARHDTSHDDTTSIDSDFPPTHADIPSSPPGQEDPTSPSGVRKTNSGGFVTNKIFGRISHAVHGIVDVDPERTRRDQIGKTKESLVQVCAYLRWTAIIVGGGRMVLIGVRVVGASARCIGKGRQGCECGRVEGSEEVPGGEGGGFEAVHGRSFLSLSLCLRGCASLIRV